MNKFVLYSIVLSAMLWNGTVLAQTENKKQVEHSGKDEIMAIVQKELAEDPRFGPYEAKLMYRQLLQNQHDQKIKKDVKLNEIAEAFNYTDERKQRLSENYNKTKPIDYQITAKDIQQVGEGIATDPTKAMTQLMVSAKINDEFMPVEVLSDVSDVADRTESATQFMQQKRSNSSNWSDNVQPIRSVQSLPIANKEPEKKQEKRLGVKIYRLNPDNFK